jgi:hypothetical protein
MDPRVKEITDRLSALVDQQAPMTDFILTFLRMTLDQWTNLSQGAGSIAPPPVGETPLLMLVESILPTVEKEDRSSSAVIRLLLDKTRTTQDPDEKRHLALALEWFYRYFNKQTDLEFETWLELRQHGKA